jgi:hypothetical protein
MTRPKHLPMTEEEKTEAVLRLSDEGVPDWTTAGRLVARLGLTAQATTFARSVLRPMVAEGALETRERRNATQYRSAAR